uniref:uncharacterized protein LOC122578746 n=1 Tax=Erigeron canadensis TaxID=72917 RepID=UPI001CB99C3F|nr:uncharacterized protein LOC122578746 [Erigeron canadensis]
MKNKTITSFFKRKNQEEQVEGIDDEEQQESKRQKASTSEPVSSLERDPAKRLEMWKYPVKLPCSLLWLPHCLLMLHFMAVVRCDVGTASLYNPPYTPSACYGNDASQFPTSNLFAAAGEGIWDNGAACGRQYLVRCISATIPQICIPGQTVQVRIIDRAQTSVSRPTREGTTMVLSDTAFGIIANQIASINIEFQQV